MDITGTTGIAQMAMSMKSQNVGLKISAAVAKQAIEQLKREGQAIVEMVQQSNMVQDGQVDIYA